ncbi:hypothetical protein EYZ11_005242 [Aspergillus tanneri]|uniref:Uncharacterized protein n=1 Tax=Aspergillus tanneri TaxID=1220188 RepID=A0A4S3JKU1_9EURO|nr:hypothetical protein EYZ11_005242 [Aspergillus tanneri]
MYEILIVTKRDVT